MSVTAVLSLPYDEFLGWFHYFSKKPIGWREDNRTYLAMLAAGAKVDPVKVFPSLKVIQKNTRKPTILESIKDSPLLFYMKSAIGGDTLNFGEKEEGLVNESESRNT